MIPNPGPNYSHSDWIYKYASSIRKSIFKLRKCQKELVDTELHFKYLNTYKSLGIIPPGLSIKKDINTGHMKNSNAKWNELLKRQSFEMLDFLLHGYDEKFIKILDSICELRDRIYGECEDLDEANSIFEKLSKTKEKYVECVELRKKKKMENHKKKFYERNQNVKNNKENIKDRKTKYSNNRHSKNDKEKKKNKKEHVKLKKKKTKIHALKVQTRTVKKQELEKHLL